MQRSNQIHLILRHQRRHCRSKACKEPTQSDFATFFIRMTNERLLLEPQKLMKHGEEREVFAWGGIEFGRLMNDKIDQITPLLRTNKPPALWFRHFFQAVGLGKRCR